LRRTGKPTILKFWNQYMSYPFPSTLINGSCLKFTFPLWREFSFPGIIKSELRRYSILITLFWCLLLYIYICYIWPHTTARSDMSVFTDRGIVIVHSPHSPYKITDNYCQITVIRILISFQK
jgi:hypothetical protein